MNVYQVVVIIFIKIHHLSCYEYFQNIKPPDNQYSDTNRQRLNNIPSAIIPTSNSNLSNDFLDHSNEDPCAIILACSLLRQPNSQRKLLNTRNEEKSSFPYSDSLVRDYRSFETTLEDNHLLGTNTYLDSGNENYMINKTVGHISQLCNTENVQGYLEGVSLNHFSETCNPEEYDFTVIFSELIHLADSSMPSHQDVRSNRARIKKKSDGSQFTKNDNTQYYSYAQDKSDFQRRSDDKISRWRGRRRKRRRFQGRKSQNRIVSYPKRKPVRMLQDWGTANAKFYGRLLWKPPNSEKYNPKCEACEDKRSQCFAYYTATYGICGVVWYLDFITDADGLIGDYFRPATTICNLATYPRTADCVWNTFQNCYRQNCGLIGMEWAAIPSLKLRTKTLMG